MLCTPARCTRLALRTSRTCDVALNKTAMPVDDPASLKRVCGSTAGLQRSFCVAGIFKKEKKSPQLDHDLSCYSFAMVFLVFLVVCMVLLAMQERLQGKLQGVVQDADAAASPLHRPASPGHDGALKSQAPTRRQRPVQIDAPDFHRRTTSAAGPHSNAPERSTPPSLGRDRSLSTGEISHVTTAITIEVEENGGAEPSRTPSPAPSAETPPAGSYKPETGVSEAVSTPSNNEDRRVTTDSVVRLHPLPIDAPPGNGERDDDEGYVDG
ncbi:uncharacterized protein [Dermacentor albipictus]|uniref:uncharacterized protein isoform X2 n=1 Tax=Dermacentor albipictus TaxID=60249 RepID=UPI0038FC6ED7